MIIAFSFTCISENHEKMKSCPSSLPTGIVSNEDTAMDEEEEEAREERMRRKCRGGGRLFSFSFSCFNMITI